MNMTTNHEYLVKAECYGQRIKDAFEHNYRESDLSEAHGKAINEFISILVEEGITVQYLVTSVELTHVKMKLDYGTLGTLRVASHLVAGMDFYRYQVYKSPTDFEGGAYNNRPLEQNRKGQYKVGIYNLVEVLMVIIKERDSKVKHLGEEVYNQKVENNRGMTLNLKGKRKHAWRGSTTIKAK